MRQTTGNSGSYVYIPNAATSPLTVNLVSSSTRVATVPASVTIPTGQNYAYFTVTAQDTLGTIQVQASAPGYTTGTMNVQVTQPRFVISASSAAFTTSGPQYVFVYATNAAGSSNYVAEDVTVTLASSAPGVASFDSVTVTIRAGEYYNDKARWLPGAVGTAQLSASDSRAAFYKYTTGTANVSVTQPKVELGWNTIRLGIGQYIDDAYAYLPNQATSDIQVNFSRIGTARTSTVPATGVTIPSGQYYSYFRLIGSSAGTDSLVASVASPAHRPDTAYTVVAAGRIDPLGGWPSVMQVGDSVAVTLFSRDPDQNVRRVLEATTWSLSSNGNIEFRSGGTSSEVITSIQVPAEGNSVMFYVKAVAAGSATATITSQNYSTYSSSITVNPWSHIR
jgi:hypothetical protein